MRATGIAPRLFGVTAIVAALAGTSAVTPRASADGQFWDIQDTSPWSQDAAASRPAAARTLQRLRLSQARVRTAGG
jgi:hypothetical protein